MDLKDQKVCVQVCGDVKKKRWRGIHLGDRLGSLRSVVDLNDSKHVKGYDMMAERERTEEWSKEKLREKVRLNEKLSEKEKEQVYELLWERKGVLSQGDEDFGTARLPEFRIQLTDETLIYQRPRHFKAPVMREIEEQCEELEKIGVIELSKSAWNSPTVPVRKPDGSLRMCIDYRRVYEVTVKENSLCVCGV
ncbi:uncharacterized protein [Macrobrachium rosenbergii]|uniref:uncharacterized protein n=1 Tax=Macrobrachium rosenbergii TaxID=79674 RepID=UPI0034D68578